MSEPSTWARQLIADLFLPKFNALHDTAYNNPPEAEIKGAAFDFRWPAPNRGLPALEVQLTVGALDPMSDRVRPKSVAQLGAAIQRWSDAKRLLGYCISLGADRSCGPRLLATDVVDYVQRRLECGLSNPPPPGATLSLHRPHLDPPDVYPEISLHRLTAETRTLVIASDGAYVPQAAPRVREAIDRKQSASLHGKRTNLVLLVHFDVDGYEGEDLDSLRKEAASGPVLFREVWGVSLLSPGERSDRLWP